MVPRIPDSAVCLVRADGPGPDIRPAQRKLSPRFANEIQTDCKSLIFNKDAFAEAVRHRISWAGNGLRGLKMETGDVGGATKAWCWSFGRCEFDESRWELRVAGEPVELERKPAEVLQYLLRHAGEVVTKAELLGSVWAGRVVVEAVLTNAVGKVRKALEGSGQEIVATLPKVGYRLVVPVSRRMVEYLPEDSRLQAGDAVPRRQNWKLEAPLARTEGNEV